MKALLSGNEAIARGAYEAGVKVAAGYPGTPSTEILENIIQYPEIYAQWSPNEKVAFEVGCGSSFGGARTLVTMKHVGVNVAADPLLTLAYTGVNGGFVVVSADDPGMHSSQNEQDNRNYAKFAKIPMLEPADSQETKDFVAAALDISEKYDTPVILRPTTRIAHSQGMVELGEPIKPGIRPYVKNMPKYVMLPGNAKGRQKALGERLEKLTALAAETPLNRMEINDRSFGIITSGISYQYVKEALPQASVLKLGLVYPIAAQLIAAFAQEVERLYVVEELDPFLEEIVTVMGFKVQGKAIFPRFGELTTAMIRERISADFGLPVQASPATDTSGLPAAPARPPVLCPGCPHRATFYMLKKLKLTVSGDIGCYTLGALPPLEAMDACVCMGASIGMAMGLEKANPELRGKTVAVIGDSTFLHSGITGLLDMVYNKAQGTVLVLDNSITAMTGHQENPATGRTLMGEAAPAVNIGELAKALGVKRVVEIDPFDLAGLEKVLKEETAAPEISLVIVKRPCALIVKAKETPYRINQDKCVNCKMCMGPGCPCIALREGRVSLNPELCTGCGMCAQLCRLGAIEKAGDTI